MASGAMTAAAAEVLESHPHLHCAAKKYQYAIDIAQNGFSMSALAYYQQVTSTSGSSAHCIWAIPSSARVQS
jgi:hypothetical protein